jgi:hypothetical protein
MPKSPKVRKESSKRKREEGSLKKARIRSERVPKREVEAKKEIKAK